MDTAQKLHDLSLRLDHLEAAGEWLARSMVHVDGGASQTGTLVTALANDIRDRIAELVTELEKELVYQQRQLNH